MFNLFTSMLSPWQWVLLASVPPAIVLLYFLKLRREPLEVPSTYLWHRTIEDLHVNSIWQRLRQNLLLFLQLLIVALIILACLRPNWQGSRLSGNRFIFLIDNSASMNATDVEPTRLEDAKKKVADLIDKMKSGDVGMLVSFSDHAKVEQPFTMDQGLLRRRLEAIEPTQRTSDIDDALRVAAGLANPGRSGIRGEDVAAADAQPAQLFVLTDGGFANVPDFAMGNLTPVYIPVGTESAHNVGIVAFSVARPPDRPERMQAFARLENFTDSALKVMVNLYLDDTLLDSQQVDVSTESGGAVEFTMGSAEQATLRLEIEEEDHFDIDNTAHAAVNLPRRSRVLLVTPKNDALELVLGTDHAMRLADVTLAEPSLLETEAYRLAAAAGEYDLVIYDQCLPTEMPRASTLTFGRIPENWNAGEAASLPQVIDIDHAHPIMQFVQLGNLRVAEGTPLEHPPGGRVLVDTDIGPLMAIAPRDAFEDIVIGFGILHQEEDGSLTPNTDWPLMRGFPVFFKNLLGYLGNKQYGESGINTQPGEPIHIRTLPTTETITITSPDGSITTARRGNETEFVFGNTDEVGVYAMSEGNRDDVSQYYVVNLFDRVESEIRPRQVIKTEYEEIAAQKNWQTTRREAWRWLVLAGIAVLLLEWYVYNRRVYL